MPSPQYYAFIDDGVQGPYSLDALARMRESSMIHRDTLLRSTSGSVWVPFAQMFEEQIEVVHETIAPTEFGGLRRFGFFVTYFVINKGAVALMSGGGDDTGICLLAFVALLFPIGMRVQNLGMSGWWTFAIFVPLLNLFLIIRCFFFPEGYAEYGFAAPGRRRARDMPIRAWNYLKSLISSLFASTDSSIVPRRAVIVVSILTFLLGWLACWALSERYRYQAIGNGRMIKSDRWSGDTWTLDRSYGGSERWTEVQQP